MNSVFNGNLRFFLFIFRLLSLLLGLVLSNFALGTSVHILPGFLKQSFIYIVILFEIFATFFSFYLFGPKINNIIIIFTDILFGIFLTYFYGSDYFMLSIIFPLFESYFLLSRKEFAASFIFIALIHIPMGMITYQYKNIEEVLGFNNLGRALSQQEVSMRLSFTHHYISQIEINLINSFIILSLAIFLLKSSEEHTQIQNLSQEQKKQIRDELETVKNQMRELFNEHNDNQDIILELQKELENSQTMLFEKERQIQEIKNKGNELIEIALQKEIKSIESVNLRNSRVIEQLEKEKDDAKKEKAETEKEKEDLILRINSIKSVFESVNELNLSVNPEKSYINIVSSIQKFLPSQTCVLFLSDSSEGQKKLFPEVAASPYESFFQNISYGLKEGIVGWSCFLKTAIKIDDTKTMIDDNEIDSLIAYERSAISVPLIAANEVIGALYLGKARANGFTELQTEKLVNFAAIISLFMKNIFDFNTAVSDKILDKITNTYNDIYFNKRLPEEIKRAKRYKFSIALLVIDIDNFSAFNEEYGISTGNSALGEIADIIKGQIRETDILGRTGDDEFGIILLHTDKNTAEIMSEKIKMTIGLRSFPGSKDKKINLSVTVGISIFPDESENAQQLIEKANENLIKNKFKPDQS